MKAGYPATDAMKQKFLSVAEIKRVFKRFKGRINLKGCLEFQKNVKDYAELIAKIAVKNTLYEGRRLVKDKDIKEAMGEIKK